MYIVPIRQITVLLLLVAFALQTFNRAFMVFDYRANTNAYARNCENKARPTLHCNGQCQLMKKLRKEERKDQQNPERKVERNQEILLSSKAFYPFIEAITLSKDKAYTSIYTVGHLSEMPRIILRPPIR